MKLHLENEDFNAAIIATSKGLNIREVFIEKDYWVTYVLKKLSESSFKDKVVFKGGTSLSKAYKIIDRFSEDIDLAVILDGENSNQTKAMIQKIEKAIALSPLKEIDVKGKTSKGSRFRKTVWQYPKKTKEGSFGDASQNILLEVNSFAQPFPHEKRKIKTYIADFLIQTGDTKAVTEYQLDEFDLSVLDFKRTFAEKIAGIARACFESDENLNEMKAKIRHLYDIAMLYRNSEIKEFIDSGTFWKVCELVKKEDAKIQSAKDELENEWMDAVIFKSPKEILKKLKDTYENQFSTLIYRLETCPTLDELEQVILKVTASKK